MAGNQRFHNKIHAPNHWTEKDPNIPDSNTDPLGSDELPFKGPFTLTGHLSAPFNGNRTVTRSGIPNINVGKEHLLEFIEAYFFPAIPPSISLNGYSLNELGSVVTSVNIKGSITQNDEPLLIELRYYLNSGLVNTDTPPSAGAYSYIETPTTITSNTPVLVQLDTQDNGTLSKSTNITFAAPYYYGGDSNGNLSNNDIITKLTKKVANKSNVNLTYNTNGDYMYLAIPTSWGTIKKVLDKNDFDNTSDWTGNLRNENLILPADGTLTHPYRVYRFSTPSVYSGVMKFTF
jgi:hypothetical protein